MRSGPINLFFGNWPSGAQPKTISGDNSPIVQQPDTFRDAQSRSERRVAAGERVPHPPRLAAARRRACARRQALLTPAGTHARGEATRAQFPEPAADDGADPARAGAKNAGSHRPTGGSSERNERNQNAPRAPGAVTSKKAE